jgi:hypothetical protein
VNIHEALKAYTNREVSYIYHILWYTPKAPEVPNPLKPWTDVLHIDDFRIARYPSGVVRGVEVVENVANATHHQYSITFDSYGGFEGDNLVPSAIPVSVDLAYNFTAPQTQLAN